MKILIIGGTKAQDLASVQDTAQLFADSAAGNEVYYGFFDTLVFDVSPSAVDVFDVQNGKQITDYDVIIFRGRVRAFSDIAYVLSVICEHKNIAVKNSYSRYVSFSKLAQAFSFYSLGLPFARTLYSLDKQLLEESILAKLSLPVIVKDAYGAHGNENYLVQNKEDLSALLKNKSSVDFIAQDYVANSGDYRVLVAGKSALYIYREAAAGSHLNNTSQGAQATLHAASDLPELATDGAFKVAEYYDCDIAGVDVLKSTTGEYYFLEINTQPQLATGAFLAEKKALLADFLRITTG